MSPLTDELLQLVATKNKRRLKEINQRCVWNSFFSIDMGADIHGICGKCHTEAMHSIQEGIVKYLMDILIAKVIPASKLIKFDEYISCMCSHIGDHGKDLFPRISWCNGFSKLTNLTAADRVGKMFTCLLFLLTHHGSKTGHEECAFFVY